MSRCALVTGCVLLVAVACADREAEFAELAARTRVDFIAHRQRGLDLLRVGQLEGAQAELERCLELFEPSAAVHGDLARLHAERCGRATDAAARAAAREAALRHARRAFVLDRAAAGVADQLLLLLIEPADGEPPPDGEVLEVLDAAFAVESGSTIAVEAGFDWLVEHRWPAHAAWDETGVRVRPEADVVALIERVAARADPIDADPSRRAWRRARAAARAGRGADALARLAEVDDDTRAELGVAFTVERAFALALDGRAEEALALLDAACSASRASEACLLRDRLRAGRR